VVRHYLHGSLERTILDALAAAGKDVDHLTPVDLAAVDEFHIGGRQATIDLAAQLDIRSGLHLLDVGCGLGGASRYFAHERGCRVTGIDLAEEYVDTAEVLARLVGLAEQVSYRHGSALDLPFPSGRFDGAYMLHVGMNIEDKSRLFREVRRVLGPGGFFAIYDVMRESEEGDLNFPLPWASSSDINFIESAATYRHLLEGAGFVVRHERSRLRFAIELCRTMRSRALHDAGRPPLGLHIPMGASAPQKVANMIDNLERGLIAPTEIIGKAV
jgi:SAM-dependent methyltransferase